jgi:hypothetical protein
MAGYDPKAKRTHSPATTEGRAPVDDLLSVPAAPPVARPAPTGADPVTSPRVTPPAATGPDPKVLAVVAGVAVLAIILWRRRH